MRNFRMVAMSPKNKRGRKPSMSVITDHGLEIKSPYGGTSFYKLEATCKTKPYEYSYQKTANNHKKRMDTLQERLVYALCYYHLTIPFFTELANQYAKDIHSKIRFSPVTMHSYCKGKYAPKIDRLMLIAGTLDVPVSWLMGYGARWLPDDFDPDVVNFPDKNNNDDRLIIKKRKALVR